MLAENQIKRLLKQCEKVESQSKDTAKYTAERNRNLGWCQALRLVLEKNTHPISNKPID